MAEKQSSGIPAKVTLLILSFVPLFLALGFLQIIITAWLVTIGFTAAQVGALIAAQGLAVIFTSIPLGIVSDVYGRKYLLTFGALAGAGAMFAFSLTLDFWTLLTISLVLGFTEGAAITTWNALLADMTEGASRNKVFSLSFIMINVTTGVGLVLPGTFPFLQGILGLTNMAIHKETLMLLGVLSFATPLMFYLLLRDHRETHNPGRKWGGLSNKSTIVKLGVVGSTIGFGAGFIIPLVGTWFFFRFNVTDEFSGPILAFSNILIGFSAVASPRLASRFGQMRAIILTTGTSMAFMLSMAFVPLFAAAAVIYVVRSALMNMAGPLIDSFSMGIFPAEQRGLVSALSNIMFRLPNSISSIFGGIILGLGFLELPLFIASAFYIVGLTAFYLFFVAGGKYPDRPPTMKSPAGGALEQSPP
ncbi:MAG: MFS transporter [Thaumarchaeota archaeon]|nr:MFS transporter [Nitrososphaerota archaeon]